MRHPGEKVEGIVSRRVGRGHRLRVDARGLALAPRSGKRGAGRIEERICLDGLLCQRLGLLEAIRLERSHRVFHERGGGRGRAGSGRGPGRPSAQEQGRKCHHRHRSGGEECATPGQEGRGRVLDELKLDVSEPQSRAARDRDAVLADADAVEEGAVGGGEVSQPATAFAIRHGLA